MLNIPLGGMRGERGMTTVRTRLLLSLGIAAALSAQTPACVWLCGPAETSSPIAASSPMEASHHDLGAEQPCHESPGGETRPVSPSDGCGNGCFHCSETDQLVAASGAGSAADAPPAKIDLRESAVAGIEALASRSALRPYEKDRSPPLDLILVKSSFLL